MVPLVTVNIRPLSGLVALASLCATLTMLQPFSNEEVHAYERARRHNAREEMPRMQGKPKDGPIKSPTLSWSEPPAYQPTALSTLPLTTTNDGATHAPSDQVQRASERVSYDLARQLQAQEDAALQEHQRVVREAAGVKLFDCTFCLEKYREHYSASVKGCGHVFCKYCMKEHVQLQVRQSKWPVQCPMCVADEKRTEQHGSEHEPAPPLNYVAALLTIMLLVITRDLVGTLEIDEAVLIQWMKLETDKVSVAVGCPR